MLLLSTPAKVFNSAADAEAVAVHMADAAAGEYFTIHADPAGSGRCIVSIHEADGYLISHITD